MYFLGIDLGSSSVKLSVLDGDASKIISSVTIPEDEMSINAPEFGWAEQDPTEWWDNVKSGLGILKEGMGVDLKKIGGIGIAYQMHGLVLTDATLNPLRPSVIWCDSRAVQIGEHFYQQIGETACLSSILGSPGNFTASKLRWVKEHEPEIFEAGVHLMLPGDYIASMFSRIAQTSVSGLSEAALWDFSKGKLASQVLDKMELPEKLIPEVVPNFGKQAIIHPEVAAELGLNQDVQITYRAGDQPNNAFSLNVLKPGEVAATAGTSAVIYSVSDQDIWDEQQRINSFLHVNNTTFAKSNGVMACINGSGILYQWIRKILSVGREELVSYEWLNSKAALAPVGSEGLRFYPFGNGTERIFGNKEVNSGIENLSFNIHDSRHLIRAACEGIVFAMNYGYDVMKSLGVSGKIVRAGNANLFLSPVFKEIFANTTQSLLELYNTSGSEGAARGAALGYGFYASQEEALEGLDCVERIEPDKELSARYEDLYSEWKSQLKIKHND